MPVGSLIIGVDLDPIKPIRGVKTIVGDITTQKCRQMIKKVRAPPALPLSTHPSPPRAHTPVQRWHMLAQVMPGVGVSSPHAEQSKGRCAPGICSPSNARYPVTYPPTHAPAHSLAPRSPQESNNSLMDVVLCDGAPNVGGAWSSEAYTQAWLVLEALRMACDTLAPRGAFVTKVFRWGGVGPSDGGGGVVFCIISEDYTSAVMNRPALHRPCVPPAPTLRVLHPAAQVQGLLGAAVRHEPAVRQSGGHQARGLA